MGDHSGYARLRRGKRLRAIDLYSGVGGWSLGLRLAGIEVVASYEKWGAANETNFKNNRHQAHTVDIRHLDLADLPTNIDFVVGSPPCTQFSFSNRGGGGNISDGLLDIHQFLTIVDHLKPKAWVMENVPRVAGILKEELKPGGSLRKFAHLVRSIHVFNTEEFGLPQRRRRCFAGTFDHSLLERYKSVLPRRTLGDVLDALAGDVVMDPLYGVSISRADLHDHDPEDYLNEEEERINRASKASHPVYNAMLFPDPRDRSVRTITATCTRVSRESIVIDDPANSGKYRRLTVRERASLQGFPFTFQFYGENYGQKLRMIGNAVPPAFTFLLAHTLRGTSEKDLPKLASASASLPIIRPAPPLTPPDRTGSQYRPNRAFRFAIPSLRLKSGVRFEFANQTHDGQTEWIVRFIFGTSKDIRTIDLSTELYGKLLRSLTEDISDKIGNALVELSDSIDAADVYRMQNVWSRQGPGRTRPFMVLDILDHAGERIVDALEGYRSLSEALVEQTIIGQYKAQASALPGLAKLRRYAPLVATGLLVGTCANTRFAGQARSTGGASGVVC